MKKSATAPIILGASAIAFIVLSVIVFSLVSPESGSRRIDESKAGTTCKHPYTDNISKISIKAPGYGRLGFKIVAGKTKSQCVEISGEYDDCFNVSTTDGTLYIEIEDTFEDYIDTEITISINDDNLASIETIGECHMTLEGLMRENLSMEVSGDIKISTSNITTLDYKCTNQSWGKTYLSGELCMIDSLNVTSRCDLTIDNTSNWIENATFTDYDKSGYTILFTGYRPAMTIMPSEDVEIALCFSNKTFIGATKLPVKDYSDRPDSDMVIEVAVDTTEITSE